MSPKIKNILALLGIMAALYLLALWNTKMGNPNLRLSFTIDRIWIIELSLAIALLWEITKKK